MYFIYMFNGHKSYPKLHTSIIGTGNDSWDERNRYSQEYLPPRLINDR